MCARPDERGVTGCQSEAGDEVCQSGSSCRYISDVVQVLVANNMIPGLRTGTSTGVIEVLGVFNPTQVDLVNHVLTLA
jgi:hypothetical protein